jgi:hypothetical protein
MLLAAMLAMVLAAAAPAFAQTAVAGNVQYVDCDQIAAAVQYADADADDFSAVAQELDVSQEQILACLGDVNINTATATAGGSGGSGSGGSGGSGSGGTATASLPPTGGPVVPSSALALGAGVLLVAGGLLARRMVR